MLTTKPPGAEEWHAPAEAARILHKSPHEIRDLARRGQIPSRRTAGGHLRVCTSVEPAAATASVLLRASAVLAALAGALTSPQPTAAPLNCSLEELIAAARNRRALGL